MRNGRRTISVLLVAAMTAGLAACGTTEAAENVTESETPENTDYNFTVSYDGIQTGDVSSGVAVSSATEMPNSRLRARRFSISGEAMSVSHLLTA